jgi:hypothetical protein
MTIAVVFAITGLLAFALIVHLAKGHLTTDDNLQKLASQLRHVDVGAFCNLIAASEQEYLRDHLPPREFRTIHRERMLAALEYVRCAARNAAILIRLGESARQHPDPVIRATGEKLLDSGLGLRLYAFQLVPRLYLSMAFPQVGPVRNVLADTYDTMNRQVIRLSSLQFPTYGMSSAL